MRGGSGKSGLMLVIVRKVGSWMGRLDLYLTEVHGADDFFGLVQKLGCHRSCRISQRDCHRFWGECAKYISCGLPLSFVEVLSLFVEWRFLDACRKAKL